MKTSLLIPALAALALASGTALYSVSSQAASYESVCSARWHKMVAAHEVPIGMTLNKFMSRPACPSDMSSAVNGDEDAAGTGSIKFEEGRGPGFHHHDRS
jgi:curli biogenesis system outer membrane secretion channel CsgG